MADELKEIANSTLVESDFNSSGEHTLLTTNSSTAHVIKSVQVSDTDDDIKVNGTLDINGFDIVALTANSSGSEIIGPSSTVKVKATGFPLRYEDDEFNTRTGSTNYSTTSIAKVNDVEVIEEVFDSTNSLGVPISRDNTRNVFAPFIGSNNRHFIFISNNNSTQNAYVYDDSTGNLVYSHTESYTPKWFDGEQYAYYYTSSGTAGIYRIDINAGSASILHSQSMGSPSSDPKMFGYEDEYLWFWGNKNEIGYVYDFSTSSVSQFTNDLAVNVYGSWPDNNTFYAVKRSNGSFRFVKPQSQNTLRYLDWSPGDVHTNSISYTDISLSGNTEYFRDYSAGHSAVGSKLYYINNDSEKVAYWDFEPNTPTHSVIGTNQLSYGYGPDLTHVKRTPSSSVISSRSYGISPSLKVRLSGVTST